MGILEIKKITTNNISDLEAISRQTFLETFAHDNTAEDMQKYLDDSFSTTKLINELSDPNSEFYFALLDKNIVGYLKINFGTSQTELKDKNSLEIERIYVIKDLHGKKVGQVLYNTAITVARQKKASYVWLGVWEKNIRAINFYKKNGFVEFDKHIFKLGSDEQTDIMMRLQIN